MCLVTSVFQIWGQCAQKEHQICPIFLTLKTLAIYLRTWGLFGKFETIYILQDWVSALRPISNNAGGPEVSFFLRFVYAILKDAERPVSTCCTVGMAWTSSAAVTRRCMRQYIESAYKYSETE